MIYIILLLHQKKQVNTAAFFSADFHRAAIFCSYEYEKQYKR